ncbi:MAG: DNA-directed RNA polymerase subunit beta, partial [Clostridia bacterium]|nr:DNA-directed RNA polymerase subunit beta [Clostridia bacterium]
MQLKPRKLGANTRMSFARIEDSLEMPNLIEVQKKSFQWFLDEGMNEVLHDVSPVLDYSGNLSVDFTAYSIDAKPKYSVEECKERGATYEAPIRMTVRLTNKETGEIKSSDIYMGNVPLMTENGTFVINGAERVIVSQIVRSPGIYYGAELDKTGKHLFNCTVIPYRGAWLEYETDASDAFYVKIDKTKRLPVTVLIRALGEETDDDIKNLFGEEDILSASLEKDDSNTLAAENGTAPGEEALKTIYKKLRPGEPPLVDSARALLNMTFFDPKRYALAAVGRYKFDKKLSLVGRIAGFRLARPVVSALTGEILAEAGQTVTREMAVSFEANAVNDVYLLVENDKEVKVFSNNTVYPEHV